MKTAWFGEPLLKQKTMDMLREDRRLDRIVQNQYWLDGRGCHLGCLTKADDNHHAETERRFGIPMRVAYVLEAVFEGLPKSRCEWWVIEGTDAIPVGADLSLLHHRLAAWLFGPDSPSREGNAHPIVAEAVAAAHALHEAAARGEGFDESAARSARSAAELAARSAARSAKWPAWESIAEKCIELFKTSPIAECEECGECLAASLEHVSRRGLVRV